MSPESEVLDRALACFARARVAMRDSFGVNSAPEIVTVVLQGQRPRSGFCINGWEYFVHGVGYTVVLPSGGQVHFDGSAEGDFFTTYDVAFFTETDAQFDELDVATIRAGCEDMAERGFVCRLGGFRYSLRG